MRSSESTLRSVSAASIEIPSPVREAVQQVASYMGERDDWVDVKKEIMRCVRPELRRLFSRRDQATRDQRPNDFDLAVLALYSEISGTRLVIRTLAERQALRACLEDE